MTRTDIKKNYFEWMFDLVCGNRYSKNNSYKKLLSYLHSVEYVCCIKNDADRACDGVNLRHRFALLSDDYEYVRYCLDGPCSVLEMIVALAIRCEETIMDDPQIGNRTGQWFWKMITNLGLGSMIDRRFDERYAAEIVDIFLNRRYDPDGHGGLFVIRNCHRDLRDVDVWTQMMWYLDTLV